MSINSHDQFISSGEEESPSPQKELKELPLDFSYYQQAAEKNLFSMSRTAVGRIDVSASTDKASKMEEGLTSDVAAQRVRENFYATIKHLYQMRDARFDVPNAVKKLIIDTAESINRGITSADASLLRAGADSAKFSVYTLVKDVPQSFDHFCEELYERLHNPATDAVDLAAWMEYRINLTGHFFSDGCGKVSLAMSTWAFMRDNKKLPIYSREQYFAHAPKVRHNSEHKLEDDQEWLRFRGYFRSL